MNPLISSRVITAMDTALGLITAGTEIVSLLKGKDTLTDEELQAIIDKQNEKQAEARAALMAMLGK